VTCTLRRGLPMRPNRRPRIDTPDEFANAYLDRRGFLKQVTLLSGGTAAAAAWLARWGSNVALGEFVAKDDRAPRRRLCHLPRETGDIRAFAARPRARSHVRRSSLSMRIRACSRILRTWRGASPWRDFTRLRLMPCRLWEGPPPAAPARRLAAHQLNYQATVKNFVAAVQYLKTHPLTTGKVGCTGFCWGGAMRTRSPSMRRIWGGGPFYGAAPAAADVPKIKAALLCTTAPSTTTSMPAS